ncbi:hypothetical protein NGRA_0102 [Nosema granulosis]|uniref:Dolichol kinase n=1 Tax=Nosema granulosis TaxID=83296 RepID=A0A9P6H0X7_9MICR|nr:hypothetical protein NGRA_0102 [Nosema granulosis]
MDYKDLIDITISIILLGRLADSINILERIIVSIAFNAVEKRSPVTILLARYFLIVPDIGDRLCLIYLFRSNLSKEVWDGCIIVLKSREEMFRIVLMGIACILTQLATLWFKIKYTKDTNIYQLSLERRNEIIQFRNYKLKKNKACRKKPNKLSLGYSGVRYMMINKRDRYMFRFRTKYHLKYCNLCLPDIALFKAQCVLFSAFHTFFVNLFRNVFKDRIFLTNISRKVFHLFVFLVFHHPTNLNIILGEFSFLFFVVLSDYPFFSCFFKEFLSKNDRGRITMSHLYLLAAVIFPYYFLSPSKYSLNLTSICIFDSFTSFVGTFMGKKSKSYTGSIVALLVTLIFEYTCLEETDTLYFILVALVERIYFINDNISIPLFSVLYFSTREALLKTN